MNYPKRGNKFLLKSGMSLLTITIWLLRNNLEIHYGFTENIR